MALETSFVLVNTTTIRVQFMEEEVTVLGLAQEQAKSLIFERGTRLQELLSKIRIPMGHDLKSRDDALIIAKSTVQTITDYLQNHFENDDYPVDRKLKIRKSLISIRMTLLSIPGMHDPEL